MAILWAIIMKLSLMLGNALPSVAIPLVYMAQIGVLLNFILMVLNLLPIPPLDGSRILYSIMPPNMVYFFSKIEPYGIIILLILLFTGILTRILGPILHVLLITLVSLLSL